MYHLVAFTFWNFIPNDLSERCEVVDITVGDMWFISRQKYLQRLRFPWLSFVLHNKHKLQRIRNQTMVPTVLCSSHRKQIS